MHKYLPQMAPIVWTQFVVQTDSALTQWAQDNKFVKSGLENWVLVNSSYHYHKFKDNFIKQMGKDSRSEKLYFYINQYFSYAIVDKLLVLFLMIFSNPLFIKDSLH